VRRVWGRYARGPGVWRGYCSECINQACAIVTVYDRKRDQIEKFPANLRKYLTG